MTSERAHLSYGTSFSILLSTKLTCEEIAEERKNFVYHTVLGYIPQALSSLSNISLKSPSDRPDLKGVVYFLQENVRPHHVIP